VLGIKSDGRKHDFYRQSRRMQRSERRQSAACGMRSAWMRRPCSNNFDGVPTRHSGRNSLIRSHMWLVSLGDVHVRSRLILRHSLWNYASLHLRTRLRFKQDLIVRVVEETSHNTQHEMKHRSLAVRISNPIHS